MAEQKREEKANSTLGKTFGTKEYEERWSRRDEDLRMLYFCLDIVHIDSAVTYINAVNGLLVAISSPQLRETVHLWLRHHCSLSEGIVLIEELKDMCEDVKDVIFYLNNNIFIKVDRDEYHQEKYRRVPSEADAYSEPGYRL